MIRLRPAALASVLVPTFFFALVAFAALSLWAPPASAACMDPPGQGVNWQRCAFDGLDLSGVNLAQARLRDGSFLRSKLSGADLSGVEAFRAKFINADLSAATLVGAQLFQADMTKANLRAADLQGADLRGARLYHADLKGANLTGARLEGADLTQADLSGATWTNGEHVCREGSVGRCN